MFAISAAAPGFWGAPTASVDWCEENYRYSPYVCELFNTLSSFALVLAGALGWWLHRTLLEPRFRVALLALGVVGLGSIAFHATLRFELQMLDELPMLWLALVMVYALLEEQPVRRFGLWFPALLVAGGVLMSLLTALSRGRVEFWVFQVSFTSTEFYGLYRVWRVHRRSHDPRIHRLFRSGMAFYALAVASWLVDIRLCSFVSRTLPALGLFNPELHAVWHVLVAFGFYTLVVLIALDRCNVLEREVRLDRWLGIVPRLAPR